MIARDVVSVVLPIFLAALAGRTWARRRGRFRGLWIVPVAPAATLLLGAALVWRWPVVGLWDALLEGWLVGVAFVWAGHRLFADWRATAVAMGSLALALAALEVSARVALPQPPAFTSAAKAHLFLSDALAANPEIQPADAMAKELVCALAYGPRYQPLVEPLLPDVPRPATFPADPQARRRVLHLGDSMVYGAGVDRADVFPALLEKQEPGAQHIDAAIISTAPDDYLTVARAWLRSGPHLDLALMYVFEGNDLRDMDSPHRCSSWQSLLTYDSGTAQPRFPDGPRVKTEAPDLAWLLMLSPPPYLLRLMNGFSVSAAFASAALVERWHNISVPLEQSTETQWAHLHLVLETAAHEFRQRGIPFAVVYLPERTTVEARRSRYRGLPESPETLARELQVPVLDPLPSLTEAVARGEHLYLGARDIHYNQAGHSFMAQWLHEQLARAFPGSR